MRRARRIRHVIVALALSVAGAAVRAEDASAPLRVMSFNTRVDLPSDGPDVWPLRKEKATSTIRFHRADLVGLQETLRGRLDDLDTPLAGFGRLGTDGAPGGAGRAGASSQLIDRLVKGRPKP